MVPAHKIEWWLMSIAYLTLSCEQLHCMGHGHRVTECAFEVVPLLALWGPTPVSVFGSRVSPRHLHKKIPEK